MRKLIECVPNFSEGQNTETITAIADAISSTSGCFLLDVDPGKSTNRTVYTFVGDPKAVVQGALNAAKVARKKIDMSTHKGEHPRMGAMDVCPFIPVAGVTMQDCIKASEELAGLIAEELHVPVYLYEHSARADYRKTLQQVREGEYEGIAGRITEKKWKPDFGPAEFIPAWGITAVGAREFLIAYNVNILGTHNQAHRIALNLRTKGRGPGEPGRLEAVQGMGWYVDDYNLAQVTVNLTNYKTTPMHILFEEVKKDAAALHVGVSGSEVVGLIPLDAILMAADYYIEKENLFILDEDQKIRLATDRMGLGSVAEFDPKKKIIEYCIEEEREETLAGLSVRRFIETVGARSSAPGGGSVAAGIGALGAALTAMVAKLTYGVRKFEHCDGEMRQAIPVLHDTFHKLIPMIDADTNAFNDYVTALGLPKNTEKEKTYRQQQMQQGLKQAIGTPLRVMELGDKAWDELLIVAKNGNPNCQSDIEVGARALELGIWGAWRNVLINIKDITDETFKQQTMAKAEAIVKRAEEKAKAVLAVFS